MEITLNKAAQRLEENDFIHILTHDFPDGDTLGSASALCLALRKQGKKAQVICAGGVSEKFSYLFEELPEQVFEPRYIVSVDVADIKLLGSRLEHEYRDRVDLCIDHHSKNGFYAKETYVESDSAAAGEIIYFLLKEMHIEIDRYIAQAIYTAISTDTGCFKYGNTTSRTHYIASELMKCDFDFLSVNRAMFELRSRRRVEFDAKIMSSIEYYSDGRCAVMCVTRDILSECGISGDEIDGLASIPRTVEGVVIGITIRELESGDNKISVRTSRSVNACEICKELGGGGHAAAAGCTIQGSVEYAKEKILQVAEKYLAG